MFLFCYVLDLFDVGFVENDSIDIFGIWKARIIKCELVIIMTRIRLSQSKMVHPFGVYTLDMSIADIRHINSWDAATLISTYAIRIFEHWSNYDFYVKRLVISYIIYEGHFFFRDKYQVGDSFRPNISIEWLISKLTQMSHSLEKFVSKISLYR